MRLRYGLLLVSLATVFLSVGNAHALGATATVKTLDLANSNATIEIVNTSDKDITAFSVFVDAVRASGPNEHSEEMLDYDPYLTSKGEVLHPGATTEVSSTWVTATNPILTVNAKVVAVVYSDQTAEVLDQEAFQRIVQHRMSAAHAVRKSADIIKVALADLTDNHPSIKAVGAATEVLKQAESSHSLDMDTMYLQGIRDEVQRAPLKSAERGISERDYLSEQLVKLQEKAALYEKYARVRRVQ